MNREEIRDRILFALNDDISSPVAFTTAEIDEIIEEANEIVTEEISEIQRTAYAPMRNGAMFYTTDAFADNVMVPTRIWLATDDKRLDFITIRQLNGIYERWLETTTRATSFPNWWFPVSWNTFGVWPGVATASGLLRMDYVAWPRTFIDDSDEPEFSESIQETLILYGIYYGLAKQWDIVRALDSWGEFVGFVLDRDFKNVTEKFQRRVMWRLGFGVGGPIQSILPP